MSPVPALPPPRAIEPGESKIDILDFFSVMLRRWKIIVMTILAVFVVVTIFTFLKKPIYEASATIQVKDDQQKGAVLGDLGLKDANPVSAEIELIKSRTNAKQVVERLHLHWKIDKKSNDLSFKLMEFSSAAKEPVYKITLTGADTFNVKDTGGNLIGEGKSGNLLKVKDLTLLIDNLKGEKGSSFHLRLASLNTTAEELRRTLKVTEVGRMTGIISVSYTSTDPFQSKDVVNELVKSYINHSVHVKAAESEKTVSFLDKQLKELSGDLDSSEDKLQNFKSITGVVQLDNEAESLISKISEMERERASVGIQRQQMEFAANAMKNAKKKGEIYSAGNMGNDSMSLSIASLSTKLSELQVQKSELLSKFTPAHQAVKSVQSQIDEMQDKILSSLETSKSNLTKQEKDIANQIKIYDNKIKKLPAVEQNLASLTRVSNVNSDMYTFLLQKHEESRIAKESTISNLDIVDPADLPEWPISPNIPFNIFLSFIVGLTLGIGLAFSQEYLDDSIKDADQAKRVTGMFLLGTIPPFIRREVQQTGLLLGRECLIPQMTGNEPLTSELMNNKNILITESAPKSLASEAFRALRTGLHFSAISKDKKTMLFTSTFPREGKSTISSNTAIVMAQTGARVLVVDCDLRRSSQHEKFGCSKTPGLSEVLTRDVTIDQAINKTAIPGLDLLCAGTTPPNPSELLGSEEMSKLLMSQRENYDFIIIDAPPVLAVTDAPVLTKVSDIVILVMEAGRVPVKAAENMRDILASLNAHIAGIVLNDRTGKGERFSYYSRNYYGRAYGYKSGYGHGYYSDEQSDQIRKGKRWENVVTEKLMSQVRKYLKK